jgi:hypothetical protein
MPRHNKTGRSKGELRHVRLYHWVQAMPAWRDLDTYARALYIELASLYAGVGTNNAFLSCRRAAQLTNSSISKMHDAFWQLESHGFIVAISRGHFDHKHADTSRATVWRLTEFPANDGSPPSHEFTRWENLKRGSHKEPDGSYKEPHGSHKEPMLHKGHAVVRIKNHFAKKQH